MRKILLSFAAIAAVASMQAESTTYSVNDATDVQGTHNETTYKTDDDGNPTTDVASYENYQPVESLKLGDYSFTFSANEEAKTQPAYYNSKSGDWTIRLYANNIMTITSTKDLSSIAFTFASAVSGFTATPSEGSGTLSTDNKTYTWNRPQTEQIINSVSFTIDKNCRISSVTFADEAAAEPETIKFTQVYSGIKTGEYKYVLYFSQQTDESSISCIVNPLDASYTYGYLQPTSVTPDEDDFINVLPSQAFIITEDGTNSSGFPYFTIKDESGRYLYMSGTYNSFNVSTDRQTDDSDRWDITFDENGYALIKNVATGKTIQYSVKYKSAGAYTDISEDNLLPILYVEYVSQYPEKIWLIGSPEGWDINGKDAWTLAETSEGVYNGRFTINSGEAMFRFYTATGDWETNSIGAQVDDNPVDITLTDGIYNGAAVNGKGSWNIPAWETGILDITVDLANMKVQFKHIDDSGVSSIATDNAAAEYYTINGIRMNSNSLTPGLYIKRVNGKTEKVIIRK